MKLISKNNLKYFEFESLLPFKLAHGIFSRHGGVSNGDYDSLNVGGNNGDIRENVIENRRRMFEVLDRKVESLYDVWQVHGDKIIETDKYRPLDELQEKADAIITKTPGITLFMRFGDCVPIILYDPMQHAIALIHAGWTGTVSRIVKKTVEKMQSVYKTEPRDIFAGIGPSIGPDHYEVREDVIEKVEESFGTTSKQVLINRAGRVYLDLWVANKLSLQESGVKQIEIAEICTACNYQDWFSHRASSGKTGRFGALISLN